MISKIIDEELIQKIDRIIQASHSLVIITHENPDGDAIGSSLAMADFLKCRGKESVKVMIPNDLPSFLSWMPGAEDIMIYNKEEDRCKEVLKEAEALLFLDLNALDRTGRIADAVKDLTAHFIMMDHHPNPQLFTHLTISYPEFSSNSEIIFRYICRVGCFDILSENCAVCIYTGMMTDTGNFSYNSNNSEIYLIINLLMEKGINKDKIYRNVYSSYSLGRMRMKGYILYKAMEIMPDGCTAVIRMSKREMKKFYAYPGETDGFVNMPLDISGITVSIFAREDDVIRISFRSVGDVPVNQLANELFSGGGHKNAAGAHYNGTLDEAVQIIKDALPDFYRRIDRQAAPSDLVSND